MTLDGVSFFEELTFDSSSIALISRDNNGSLASHIFDNSILNKELIVNSSLTGLNLVGVQIMTIKNGLVNVPFDMLMISNINSKLDKFFLIGNGFSANLTNKEQNNNRDNVDSIDDDTNFNLESDRFLHIEKNSKDNSSFPVLYTDSNDDFIIDGDNLFKIRAFSRIGRLSSSIVGICEISKDSNAVIKKNINNEHIIKKQNVTTTINLTCKHITKQDDYNLINLIDERNTPFFVYPSGGLNKDNFKVIPFGYNRDDIFKVQSEGKSVSKFNRKLYDQFVSYNLKMRQVI